jgi:hypothetical protein
LVGAGVLSARLRDRVTTVDIEAQRSVALAMVPLRSVLVAADGDGIIRVASYATGGTTTNRFHAATGARA